MGVISGRLEELHVREVPCVILYSANLNVWHISGIVLFYIWIFSCWDNFERILHVQCFHHALRPSEESRLFLKWFQFILLSFWWPGFLSVLESLSALWRTFSVLEATPRAQEPKKRRIARCLFRARFFIGFHRIFFTFRVHPGRQNHGFRMRGVTKITLSPQFDFS